MSVERFIQLDQEIEAAEAASIAQAAAAEDKRWEQAQVAYEATNGPMTMTQRAFADRVGKSQSHIDRLVRTWRRFGLADSPGGQLPRFADAYNTIKTGSDAVLSKAETSRQERERQVPTRHEDRVQMAAKLLADRKVADAVVAQPTQAASVVRQSVSKQNAKERRQASERNQKADEASALPFPAHLVAIRTRIGEFARDLAALHDDYAELPGPDAGTDRALAELIVQAERWRTAHATDDTVIEGTARDRLRALPATPAA